MLMRRLRDDLYALGSNRGGNVAMTFGLAMVPLILLVGASIDYTRSVTRKTSLQQAADATSLAIAHYLTKSMSSADLTTNAKNYFAAAVNDSRAWIDSGPTVSTDGTQVCIVARTKVPTMIMQVAAGAGMTPTTMVTVVANSCAKINNNTYEVAMVLDNSGSMADSAGSSSKIDALQDAATQMVNILNPDAKHPKTTFSLVPFSLAVNVGTQYSKASWIDTSGVTSIAGQNYRFPQGLPSNAFAPTNRFSLLSAMGQSWGGCVEERPSPYTLTDDPADSKKPDTLFEPYLYPDENGTTSNNSAVYKRYSYTMVNNYLKDEGGGSCSNKDKYWQADQSGSTTPLYLDDGNPRLPRGDTQTMLCKYNSKSNVQALDFEGRNSGFVTGPNLLCDSQPITTLTNSNDTLISQINAMSAKGSTNLLSGVMWGWRTISPNGPFNTQTTASGAIGLQNAKAYSTQSNVKVLILMTDGMNSWADNSSYSNNNSTYSPFGFYENARLGNTTTSNWRSVLDSATLQACTNIKQAGITIYTVGFSTASGVIDADGKTLLQNCASSTSKYYPASNRDALVAAFNSIAADMSGLRLTN